MNEYTGLYTQSLSDGTIYAVQVKQRNYELSFSPDQYRKRKIMPPIEQLPDEKEYKSMNHE